MSTNCTGDVVAEKLVDAACLRPASMRSLGMKTTRSHVISSHSFALESRWHYRDTSRGQGMGTTLASCVLLNLILRPALGSSQP